MIEEASEIESQNHSAHPKPKLSTTNIPLPNHKSGHPVRHSLIISNTSAHVVNELADSKNHAYVQHLEEYYEQLQLMMSSCGHKRIHSQIIEFVVFIANQIILTLLQYFMFCNYKNSKLLIQIFSILTFVGGFYMVSIHLLRFGSTVFMRIYFSLDKMTLLVLAISMINAQMINAMDFSQSCKASMKVFFPIWLFYSAGCVRMQVRYYKWSKMQIVLSKLVHLTSFICVILTCFYLVYRQNYKLLSGTNSCQIIYIYCLAVCLFFIQFYSLISRFDGTNDFRSDYVFEDRNQSSIRKKKVEMQQKLESWRIKK